MRNKYCCLIGGLFMVLALGVCPQTAAKETALSFAHEQTVATHKAVPRDPWMWVSGTRKNQAVYGLPPPGRAVPAWDGRHRNLWLFVSDEGGLGSELWEYAPTLHRWTSKQWLSCTLQCHHPASRYDAATWTGPHGGFWLFGGETLTTRGRRPTQPILDSLWRYTPKSGWKRIGGCAMCTLPRYWPEPRYGAATWTGAHGDFWLFGGVVQREASEGPYTTTGDGLWKYDPTTALWTWMGGSKNPNEDVKTGACRSGNAPPPTLPTPPMVARWPRRRAWAVTWVGPHGDLWLFGGAVTGSERNDLWKYAPKTGRWTWMGGSRHHNRPAIRGTEGVAAAANWPSPRYGAVGWTGPRGNLWLFGGIATHGSNVTYLHSMWKYTVATGLWTWMGSRDRSGNEKTGFGGRRRVPTDQGPSKAAFASAWTGPHGHFWLFGGYGDANDLWRYTP